MTGVPDRLQTALSGAYTIERELGGGGMSQVFLARDETLGRQVVVKLLSEELASGVSADRFRREVQVVAQLQHPNIVPLLSAGEAGGVPYFTMPYVQGESLRVRIGRSGELPVADTLRILRDVARALDYAHSQGVVHRDIKPDNVLISGDYALVTDFGVGKALNAARRSTEDTLTQFGVAVGTPAYMAPEQAAGDGNIDHRADIYAFGCLAYEMLVGHPPFEGRSAHELLAAHIAKEPTPVKDRRPQVPDGLAELVMRCLEKRPADRPQGARELVQALEFVATPTGTEMHPYAPRARRSLRRFGLVATAVFLLALAAALIAKWRQPAVVLDDGLITVLPFRVSAADPSLRYLREGMVDLVAAKLTGDYRAVDPRTVLSAWRRGGGTDDVDLVEAQGLQVARSLQSGQALQGEIVGNAGQLVISGTLLDAERGTPRARARVQGAATALAVLVDSLVARLLVLESGGDAEQSVQLAGTPLPALEAYLGGQRAYRAGRYSEAIERYESAVRIDTGFAQAALGLRMAAGWIIDARAAPALQLARRHRDRLSRRDQLLVQALPHPTDGTTCRDELALQEAALERASDMPELWYELGDTYFHCGDAMGFDGPRRALAAFERAIAIDSSFAPAWEHVPGILAWIGDSARARETFGMYERINADLAPFWRYMLFADSAERERLMPQIAASPSLYIATYGGVLSPLVLPQDVTVADRMLDRLRPRAVTAGERAMLLDVERKLALELGQPARAARVGRQLGTEYSLAQRMLDAVLQEGDSMIAAEAATEARRRMTAPRGSGATPLELFALGTYDGLHGRAAGIASAVAALREREAATDTARDRQQIRRYRILLDAQHAVLVRTPQAQAAVAAADSMLREGPPGTLLRAVGNLVVSGHWERLGDTARAYESIKRMYVEPELNPFWSTYRRERGRLATLTGNMEDAIRQYRDYLAVRYNPEPTLRAHVASVQRELARLEALSAGR